MSNTPKADLKKRTGRPIKEARRGRRYQIGVIVTGDVKAVVAKRAKESGRTISREVEIMIERLLQYEGMLERIYGKIEEVENRTVAGALAPILLRNGYHPLPISNPRTGKRGMAYAEPGLIEESGFVPMEEGEAMQERKQSQEQGEQPK